MNTAESMVAFHTTVTEHGENTDISALMIEAEERGDVTRDWENEATEFDFPDGSVLIVCGSLTSTYGSR